jgi:quinolinate synthase
MDIVKEIGRLKRTRGAIILAHNYQLPEIQDIADYVGDSLGLSIQAAATNAKVIVFCGVTFMAETAKILSPGKTVLVPDPGAGCPMADMIDAEDLRALKRENPSAKVLCYVNTTAAVKAECDLCCTSANAVSMVRDVMKDDKDIIFVPDRHLADHVAQQTGREFILWKGFCPTHARILPEDILKQKALHPQALVLVHPECSRGVRALADKILSTEAMCGFARETQAREMIVATEVGVLHKMRQANPDKIFYPATEKAVCPNMKLTTLEKVLVSLDEMQTEVVLDQDTIYKARQCIRRMLEYRA